VRLRKVGASALSFGPELPYPDQGQSPNKTLGRPAGRVKASAYHPAYHRRQIPVKTRSACLKTAVPSSDDGREGPRSRGQQAERGGIHTAFAGSLRPASVARCTGSSGGFASYRRDPLVEAHREGRGLVTTFSTASSVDSPRFDRITSGRRRG
jgi:hypothetical protein